MKIKISFSDLVHPEHSNLNAVPLGVAMISSYAVKKLKDRISVNIFKYPDELENYLKKAFPRIACFSNFIWNINISYEFAAQIKRSYPDTIIIFGGTNYPLEKNEQAVFLTAHPYIDFYIFRDGEAPFVNLLNVLMDYKFNVAEIKRTKINIPSCHYMVDGEIVSGDMFLPLADMDEIPSPYLTGLCDKFLKKGLMPLMLTASGCPFSCTYCNEGNEYFNKIRKFSSKRVKDELHYIAQRTSNPNLMFADSNFGMYAGDVEICREIAFVQKKYGWPKYFLGIQGKNNKTRILEAASAIQNSVFGGNSVWLSAAVQSADAQVLKNIKRQNVSLDVHIDIANAAKKCGANSFSELILCLPGDTKEAHFKSIFKLIDSGINVVRSHQLIMLPGAEVSSQKSRQKYGLVTRFRVMPQTAGRYRIFGRTLESPEIDEICVANNTMNFDDYLECRLFNLTVEIFYNNGIFQEIINLLRFYELPISAYVKNIHKKAKEKTSPVANLYKSFLRETKEIWESKDELEIFLRRRGVIERYISGEMGNNEQLMYRAVAIFKFMADLHNIAFDAARNMLLEKGFFNKRIHNYLGELAKFSQARKKNMLSINRTVRKRFHYDFAGLGNCNFEANPLLYYRPKGMNIVFSHTPDQKKLILKYVKIYGTSNYGIGNILSNASNVQILYRRMKVANNENN